MERSAFFAVCPFGLRHPIRAVYFFFLTPEDYPLGVEKQKKRLCRILWKFASFKTFGIVTRNVMGFYALFRVTFVGFPGSLMGFQEGWRGVANPFPLAGGEIPLGLSWNWIFPGSGMW